MVPSCAEGGVLGVLCATIGSIQTTEAIKVLTGIGEPLIGSLMVYDALDMNFRKVKVRKDPNCPLCSENPKQTALLPDYEAFCGTLSDAAQEASTGSTITVQELKGKIDGKEDFYLIDVREPSEFEIVRIPQSHLIPKQGFIDGSVLASLPQDKPIILHCKSGVRSAECLAILKSAGFSDASHVSGGVVAWAKQIDTSLPVY
jgi:adenylyltransferase/sulfurtransferase